MPDGTLSETSWIENIPRNTPTHATLEILSCRPACGSYIGAFRADGKFDTSSLSWLFHPATAVAHGRDPMQESC